MAVVILDENDKKELQSQIAAVAAALSKKQDVWVPLSAGASYNIVPMRDYLIVLSEQAVGAIQFTVNGYNANGELCGEGSEVVFLEELPDNWGDELTFTVPNVVEKWNEKNARVRFKIAGASNYVYVAVDADEADIASFELKSVSVGDVSFVCQTFTDYIADVGSEANGEVDLSNYVTKDYVEGARTIPYAVIQELGILGKATFDGEVFVPAPYNASHPATKKYVDDTVGGISVEDGVGIASIVQTTTSTEDGGTNVITVRTTDGAAYEFYVKNGSRGAQGIQGGKGDKGEKGDAYVLTAADKTDIAEQVEGATIVQAPKYVNSVEEMTDTSRPYVLASTGRIWAHIEKTTEGTTTEKIVGTADNPWQDGYRIGSDGSIQSLADFVTTPYIDIGKYTNESPITLKLSGVQYIYSSHTSNVRVLILDENKEKIACAESCLDSNYGLGTVLGFNIDASDSKTATATFNIPYTYGGKTVKYLRFCTIGTSAASDISISYQGITTSTEWYDTGTTYAPTLTDEDKAEIAEQAAALIDAQLLEVVGDGEVSV